MDLLPHAKLFRYGAIVLLAIIFFFPNWIPFELGTSGAVPLLLLCFLFIILSFLQHNRVEKVSEQYLSYAKSKMTGQMYLKHLKDLSALLEAQIEKNTDNEEIKKDLERRFLVVRRELTKISQ